MYLPAEDSIFFKEFLEKHFKKQKPSNDITVLDMGTGSGILAETCAKFLPKKNIFCVDLQIDCVNHLLQKGFNAIESNLFKRIPKGKKFDLILFNAPYLPRNKLEDKQSQIETTGGKWGDEISLKFLNQGKKFLKLNGKIFLLVSSLTPMNKLEKFNPKIIARKKIWFEELLILEIISYN